MFVLEIHPPCHIDRHHIGHRLQILRVRQFRCGSCTEDHDKFIICQVPCYTEGDGSLRRTIDALDEMKYDDRRKPLLVICDGMIVDSGNDRPTPRIVLDILGTDPNLDPEPCHWVKARSSTTWGKFGLGYMNARATSFPIWSLRRSANLQSDRVL